MKIVLCHVDCANLGDAVIRECACFLLRRIFADAGIDDVKIEMLNIGEQPPETVPYVRSQTQARILRRLKDYAPILQSRLAWRWSAHRRDFVARECCKLKGADAIVFAGGGIIKFLRQKFHRYIDEITAWANWHRVPVLFNAVGVEGFDGIDIRCRVLKNALNRRCVKMVTTRDDEATLREKYITGGRACVRRVADPALWTPEAFGISAHGAPDRVVGLNVIRPEIFGEYLYPVEAAELADLYAGLIRRLTAAGRRVELFSNGGVRDGAFIDTLLAAHPELGTIVSVFRPRTAEDLVGCIAGYERVLAVRLHAAIVATALKVPNVSLVWNDKQRFFGEAVRMSENFLGREDFTVDAISHRLLAAEGWREDVAYKDSALASLRMGLELSGVLRRRKGS